MRHNLEFWLESEEISDDISNINLDAEVDASMEKQDSEEQENIEDPESEEDSGEETEKTDDYEDVSDDPPAPDMPEEREEQDFEIWKLNYFKESIKGDPEKLMEMISPMREKEELEPYQRKFIEDNWNIQLIRQSSNVMSASKNIRKNIRDQLDKNNPSTSVVSHLYSNLESVPNLNEVFIKMMGYSGNKGELHRKYIAALIGAVQVSSSPDKENIIFNEKEYSIKISTRLNSEWGDLAIGSWSLKEDDPGRYLSEPELARLSDGSPQEKDVLRKRIIIESIANHFEEQSFIINVVDENGTIYYMGWDIANCLRGAYADGNIVVKTTKSENSEAMISDDGEIVPMIDLKIYLSKETEGKDEYGNIKREEVEFIERRKGMLFLTASNLTMKDASSYMQGIEYKEIPYPGNPSDLKIIKRCVYSTHDLLMRQC